MKHHRALLAAEVSLLIAIFLAGALLALLAGAFVQLGHVPEPTRA